MNSTVRDRDVSVAIADPLSDLGEDVVGKRHEFQTGLAKLVCVRDESLRDQDEAAVLQNHALGNAERTELQKANSKKPMKVIYPVNGSDRLEGTIDHQ